MTSALPSNPVIAEQADTGGPESDALSALPPEYESIRADTETQFEPLVFKAPEPREPSWIERFLDAVFGFLGEILGPVGGAIVAGWPVIQWILLAALVAFVALVVARRIGPLAKNRGASEVEADAEPEWRPLEQESLALLEDADALAKQGLYDEAARLLLKRSVGQIAQARPEWVTPSSTARELAALPSLSAGARRAFQIMSAAVEDSLFALRSLSDQAWSTARKAYADFALAPIEQRTDPARVSREAVS